MFLPRTGHPQKLSHFARRGAMREATKTATLRKVQGSVVELEETVHTTLISQDLYVTSSLMVKELNSGLIRPWNLLTVDFRVSHTPSANRCMYGK